LDGFPWIGLGQLAERQPAIDDTIKQPLSRIQVRSGVSIRVSHTFPEVLKSLSQCFADSSFGNRAVYQGFEATQHRLLVARESQ
jgi:hypothetical protein